jgi:AraC family transcriptional regulator
MITSLVYLGPVDVVAVRVIGPYSTSAAKAWEHMSEWLRTSGAMCDDTPGYGLLLDDPRVTAPADCRYEACIPLPAEFGQLPQGFSVKRMPYGTYARARHVGGKVGIAPAISNIRTEWTSKKGLVSDTARPVIEVYIDSPCEFPVEQQRIDVCVPVMFLDDQRT